MKNNINKIRYIGFSLLEISMVLAIGALIMAGVMMYYNTASVSEKTKELMDEIVSIQGAVKSLGAGQSDYSWLGGDGSAFIAQSGIIPGKYLIGMNTNGDFHSVQGIKNPFGGYLKVAAGGQVGNMNSYYIALWAIPTQACQKIATMDFGSAVIDINVNNQSFVQGRALTPKEANNACASGQNQFIAFDFW